MNTRLEFYAPKQPLQLVQREIPEAPARGAVVKLHYAGICHSDLHMWEEWSASNPAVTFPVVLGHENSGQIYSLGSAVDKASLGLDVGDLVMVFPWGGCGHCWYCRQERFNYCAEMEDHVLGQTLPGGYEEYLVVPDVIYLIPTPDGVPMDVAALLTCSGLSAYNAISTILSSVQDRHSAYGKASVLIVGAGGLGLWATQVARQLVPQGTQIIVVDAFESKFKDARAAGADHTVLWPLDGALETNIAAIKELAPDGVAGAVDFVGSSTTTSSIFGCLAQLATMVTLGLFGGQMTTPIPNLVQRQNVIRGSAVGNPDHLRQIVKLVAQGKVKPPPIRHVKLEEAPQVLMELKAGTSRGRNVIKHVK